MQTQATKVVKHLVAPGFEQARALPLVGETIQDFLVRTEWDFKIPTICVTQGKPIMRAEWAKYPADLSEITFISRPHGSGGGAGNNKMTQVAGIVGVIALAAIAPWAGGIIAAQLSITSTIGISMITAGISLGGALLLSTLMKVTAGGQGEGLADAKQVYSLTASGNSGRPLDCIPVNYGTLKIIPDFGAAPFSEYIGNDQYLNVLLVLGVGKHQVHQIQVDDTILWDEVTGPNTAFTNVEIQQCLPNVPVTLFPVDIQQSSEVNNIQIPGPSGPNGGWVGGFIANAAGTLADKIIIDWAVPMGLFLTDEDGNPHPHAVLLYIEARTVNNAGTPTSEFINIGNAFASDMTRTPQRYSLEIPVAPGRYEVRLRRSNEPQGGYADTVQQTKTVEFYDQAAWIGLRTHIKGQTVFEHEHVIAIRMKADAQLSSQSSRQFGVIQTRILPTWNGGGFVETATNNPFWAFLDCATNSLYGARRPLSKMDFQAIVDLASDADERDDAFNFQFKSFTPVPSAFDTILASARSKHCWIGDVLSVVRDEWKPIPSMLLTDHQIVRGSLEIVSIFNDETGIDCVIGEFLNEDTWKPAEVQYPPNGPGFSATTPSRIQIEGITNSRQMYQEVAFLYRQSQLRRTKVNLSTEHDGRLLRLMSAVKVQSHLPQSWGFAGEVLSLLPDNVTLRINRTYPDFGAHTAYIELRDKRGRYFGPVICSAVAGETRQVRLNAGDLAQVQTQRGMTLAQALDRMDGAEPPTFVLGYEGHMSRNCIVLSGKPSGDKVDLTLVVDTFDVHDVLNGTLPLPPTPPLTSNPKIPLVVALTAVFRMGIAEPMIDASWWPAAGAVGYKAQISYNSGVNWKPIYDGTAPLISGLAVEPAAIRLRVSAYNDIQGPWTFVDIDPPTVEIRYGAVSPASMQIGLKDYVMNFMGDISDEIRSIQQFIAQAGAEADANVWVENQQTRRTLVLATGGLKASISEVLTVALGIQTAFAEYQLVIAAEFEDVNATTTILGNSYASLNLALSEFQTSVTANLGTLNGSVTVVQTAIATTNEALGATNTALGTVQGYVATRYAVTLNSNGYQTGMQLINGGDQKSAAVFVADKFLIQLPGYNGNVPKDVFAVGLVNGVAQIGFNGNMFLTGTITAQAISIVSLSSLSANIGTITAGLIRSPDSRMIIDLNNSRIEIWS